MTKPITTPRIDKFANVRRQYDQAWCWSPGLADWFLVYDTKEAWQELNPLPAIGIRKPDPLPVAIERVPTPKSTYSRVADEGTVLG